MKKFVIAMVGLVLSTTAVFGQKADYEYVDNFRSVAELRAEMLKSISYAQLVVFKSDTATILGQIYTEDVQTNGVFDREKLGRELNAAEPISFDQDPGTIGSALWLGRQINGKQYPIKVGLTVTEPESRGGRTMYPSAEAFRFDTWFKSTVPVQFPSTVALVETVTEQQYVSNTNTPRKVVHTYPDENGVFLLPLVPENRSSVVRIHYKNGGRDDFDAITGNRIGGNRSAVTQDLSTEIEVNMIDVVDYGTNPILVSGTYRRGYATEIVQFNVTGDREEITFRGKILGDIEGVHFSSVSIFYEGLKNPRYIYLIKDGEVTVPFKGVKGPVVVAFDFYDPKTASPAKG